MHLSASSRLRGRTFHTHLLLFIQLSSIFAPTHAHAQNVSISDSSKVQYTLCTTYTVRAYIFYVQMKELASEKERKQKTI